jgi:pimeloyl-ACP methyl ester carboxylesterase
MRLATITMALAAALIFAAPQGAEARPGSGGQALNTVPSAKAAPGTLLRYEPLSGLPRNYRAKAWRILYVTRDYRNRPILSTGMVVLPDKAAKAAGQRKFVAWAHPTTGVARKCAPSLRGAPHKSIGGLNDLIAAGFVVAATDYPGLGTEGPVGYLVGKGQAYATLDSIRAAKQIPGVGEGRDFALWGYSQGGHAALFAAELAGRYAPELSLKGVAAVAPPTDLAKLMRANIDSVAGRILAAFTLSSWSTKYSARLGTLVDVMAFPLVDEVSQSCIDDLGGKLHALSAQKGLKQVFLRGDPGAVAPWSDLMVQNSLFGLRAGTPALIIQGTSDDIVRPEVTTQFVRAACRAGAKVEYVTLAGKGHGGAMEAGEKLVVKWLAARLTGQPPRSNCR